MRTLIVVLSFCCAVVLGACTDAGGTIVEAERSIPLAVQQPEGSTRDGSVTTESCGGIDDPCPVGGVEGSVCKYGATYDNTYCREPLDVECPALDPNCSGGGDPGEDSGGLPSGGEEEEEECNPLVHPDCETPLTPADTATINKALRMHLRPASAFTDSVARKDCEKLAAFFRTALTGGQVFRGSFDSDTLNDIHGGHYGMYDGTTGHIHFDPQYLDAARSGDVDMLREIAITSLHEGAHSAGKSHPNGPKFDSLGRDYYSDPPFTRLNPGPNSCIPR